jgi:DNA-damage-inducible protein J
MNTAVKTAFLRARIEPKLKVEAEYVLRELGITPTQAITMLYKKIAREHEWPIELKIPNEETQRVMDETDKGIGLISCRDSKDLFEKLGI